MTKDEFDELFPAEPPRGSIIIGKSRIKSHDESDSWAMIFAAVRKDDDDGMWHYPAINRPEVVQSWAVIRSLFIDIAGDPASYDIVDWFISEGSYTEGLHS